MAYHVKDIEALFTRLQRSDFEVIHDIEHENYKLLIDGKISLIYSTIEELYFASVKMLKKENEE